MNEPQHKVLVGVPSHAHVAADFAYDLAQLMVHTERSGADVGASLYSVQNTYIDNARLEIADVALSTGATHALFLDADMRFPKDALVRLLERDVPIVAANYSTRVQPFEPTARKANGDRVYTHLSDSGLDGVHFCGFGVMLVRTDVFRKLPEPWFARPYERKFRRNGGEDAWFCNLARKEGFQVVIDHDVSQRVSHIASLPITNEHAVLNRPAAVQGLTK